MLSGCAIKQERDSNNKCNGRKDAKSNLYASMHFAGFVFSFYCMISLPQSYVPTQNRRFLWRRLLRTVHFTRLEASLSEVT